MNCRAILNLCMPYTSRDEITTAVTEAVQEKLDEGSPFAYVIFYIENASSNSWYSEISEDDIDAHIMTNARGSPPLDILVRTSGVKRLSDYLLWQVCNDECNVASSKLTSYRAVKTHKFNTPTDIGPTSAYGISCPSSWTISAKCGPNRHLCSIYCTSILILSVTHTTYSTMIRYEFTDIRLVFLYTTLHHAGWNSHPYQSSWKRHVNRTKSSRRSTKTGSISIIMVGIY